MKEGGINMTVVAYIVFGLMLAACPISAQEELDIHANFQPERTEEVGWVRLPNPDELLMISRLGFGRISVIVDGEARQVYVSPIHKPREIVRNTVNDTVPTLYERKEDGASFVYLLRWWPLNGDGVVSKDYHYVVAHVHSLSDIADPPIPIFAP